MNTRNFKIKSKGIYKLCHVLVPEGWIILQKVSKILKSIKTGYVVLIVCGLKEK